MKTTTSPRRIGIAAPSDNMLVARDKLSQGLAMLENEGFEVVVAPNMLDEFGRFAGTHQERGKAFTAMASDESLSHLWMACGGYGALHMMPFVDWAKISDKMVWVGFSDSTILLNARILRQGIGGWHAPLFKQTTGGFEGPDKRMLGDILKGHKIPAYDADLLENSRILKAGKAKGRLIGGNLGAFRSMMGTPFAPKPQAGDILFVEELDDDLCRVDRDLEHLALAGWFEQLGGLIFGNFSEMHESTARPFGFTLEEVFARHAAKVNGPVVCDFPAGHKGLNMPLPLGRVVSLEAGEAVTLGFEGE
jgi:muramoyltetrapeptide carboxypeptidase